MCQDETVTIHEPGGKKTIVSKNQFDKPWYAYGDEPHIKGHVPDELYHVELEGSENFPDSPLLVTRAYKDAIDASVADRSEPQPDEFWIRYDPVLERRGRL